MSAGGPQHEAASPAPRAATASAAARTTQRRRGWILLGLVVTALVVLGYYDVARERAALRARLDRAERELAEVERRTAQRLQQVEQRNELIVQDQQIARGQREAIDELAAEITQGRDDVALFEVERLITLAAQELQITGQVATALAALQAADARLARVQRAQWVELRRAVIRDIERLRALPAVDVPALALKLDRMARDSDDWPLLAESGRPKNAVSTAPAAAAAPLAVAPPADGTWARIRAWLAAEFGDLVRIREIESPEALRLTEPQQRLVRLQFRLRLLTARQELLVRNERLFRADLGEAQALLTRYFDDKAAPVSAAQSLLRQWAQSPVAVGSVATLDSAAALRALRGAGAR